MKKKYGLLAELLAKEDSFYVHCTECRSLLLISRDVIRDAVWIQDDSLVTESGSGKEKE